MKSRTVLILWSVAILLGISIFILKSAQDNQAAKATERAPGETLLPEFPAKKITTIELSGPEKSVTLTQKDNEWSVSQRDNHPANTSTINELLRTLTNLKAIQGIEAGPSFAPRFGMDQDSADPAEHGITAIFKNPSGTELSKITFGKNLEAASSSAFGAGVTGRFVRNHADDSGFYAVSEPFGTVSPDPKDWLSTEFLQIEKIQSVAITKPDSDEIEWKVSRKDETEELLLGEAFKGVKTNPTAVNPLKTLFAYTRYEDVLTKSETEKLPPSQSEIKANITTFEGFTYNITLQPKSPDAQNYLMTTQVAAKLPEKRKIPEGETEEMASEADKFFTERLKTLTARLKQTKALQGKTFVVTKSTVAPLLKFKPDLIQSTPQPQPETPTPTPFPGMQ